MIEIDDIQAGALQAATGITRDELIYWQRDGYLRTVPVNPATGRARRYGLGNLIETALLKLCVSRGVDHKTASDFIHRRMTALMSGPIPVGADGKPVKRSGKDPRPWLDGSEFDPRAAPYMDDPDFQTGHGRSFWIFKSHGGGFIARSTFDDFRRWNERGSLVGVNPIEFVKDTVLSAMYEGEIVVEIRRPIREACFFLFGLDRWPG